MDEQIFFGPGLEAMDRRVLDQLFNATYDELRRLAGQVKRGDPGHTIGPTALVNEAWLRLARSSAPAAVSRLHFKRIAACAMRQILIEAARRREASKRNAGSWVITFDESLGQPAASPPELLRLNDALDALARLSPRQALVVENRFFGGFEMAEIAELLAVSEATVQRDWRAARAWLAVELRRTR